MPWVEGTAKLVLRGRVEVTRDTLVVGPIDFTHAALRRLDIETPVPNDYPESLRPYLRRRIWAGQLGTHCAGSFVKPRGRLKRWTGRVYHGHESHIYRGGRGQDIWVSEVVEWLSEWRCYVANAELVGVGWDTGDVQETLDLDVVKQAVAAFEASGEAPAGYSLDMGVLTTGETALVEVNAGYSLGAYDGISAEAYYQVISAWWAWAVR